MPDLSTGSIGCLPEPDSTDTNTAQDPAPPSGAAVVVMTREFRQDVKLVASFIVGWWPGLEDGISWGDDDEIDSDERLLAAKRILLALSSPPKKVVA